MPSWSNLYVEDASSDLSPSWANTAVANLILTPIDLASPVTKTYSIPSSSTRTWGLITTDQYLNNNSWTAISSTGILQLSINTTSMNLRARIQYHRLSSSGTIIESTGYGSFVTLDSVLTSHSPPNFTWGTASCTDRLGLEVSVENLSTMTDINFTPKIQNGFSDTLVSASISYNSSACTFSIRTIFL